MWALLALIVTKSAFCADLCEENYTAETLVNDLAETEDALRTNPMEAAKNNSLIAGLLCLGDPLHPALAPRIYRAVGAGLALNGDTESALSWYRTAVELDPTYAYGAGEIPESSLAVHRLAVSEGDSDPVSLEGTLGPGKHYLDGRQMFSPKAETRRFHIYQRSHDGAFKTWLIEGSALPSEGYLQLRMPRAPKRKDAAHREWRDNRRRSRGRLRRFCIHQRPL